ncbi:MAG: lipoate--protein ligase family protein [Bacteroidales bacterium]|nr:lipoate--protein ligase family protein [Bacteroidales bacterium]
MTDYVAMSGFKSIMLPDDGERDLIFFLAMEEYVAQNVPGDSFFIWRVKPTVIIGRNQDLEAEVNLDYCKEHGVKIVRRKSGGGCVYSDKGNVMVSYVSAKGDTASVFERYLSAMTQCLRSLGLDAEKSGRNDILVQGRKVSGNALHQLPDRTIVHGTLLYDTDLDALEQAIRPPVEKLARHKVQSVRQRVRNLAECLDPSQIPSAEALVAYILDYFCEEAVTLTSNDTKLIDQYGRESFEDLSV